MMDEQAGTSFSYRGGAGELKHEELALPDEIPAWLRRAIAAKSVAAASEALWNAVDAFETRVDAQLARELIIALPEELTRAENIALVREFVRDNLTSQGMIADLIVKWPTLRKPPNRQCQPSGLSRFHRQRHRPCGPIGLRAQYTSPTRRAFTFGRPSWRSCSSEPR